jgi:hypothetical protein
MKKVSLIGLFLIFGIAFNSRAQTTAPAEFYAGKWEIVVLGTPQGDSQLLVDLVRTEGKLSGQLSNPAEPAADKIPVSVEENGEKLALAFNAQGYDVTIDLAKVDDDNLKGTLMNMFEAKAKRVK